MDNQKFKPKFKRFSKCLRVQPRTRVAVLASASRRPATPEPLGGGPGVGRDAHTWASVFSNIFLSVYSKSTFNTLKHLRNRAQHPNAYVTNMQSSTETWAAGAELPRSPERWSRNEASLRGGFTIFFFCERNFEGVSNSRFGTARSSAGPGASRLSPTEKQRSREKGVWHSPAAGGSLPPHHPPEPPGCPVSSRSRAVRGGVPKGKVCSVPIQNWI